MRQSEVAKVLEAYGRLWPKQVPKTDGETVVFWKERFEGLTMEDVIETLDRIAMRGGYPPNPMQIRGETMRRSFGAPSADEAWLQITEQIHAVGTWADPHFEHPAVARAVRILGWKTICNSNPDEPWMLNDFRRVYGGVVEIAVEDEAISGLPEPAPQALELVEKVLAVPDEVDSGTDDG